MSIEDVDRIIYEYRREHALDDEELNTIGAEGWELVALSPTGLYVFKRVVGIEPMGEL